MTYKRGIKWSAPGGVRMRLYRHQNGECCYCEAKMTLAPVKEGDPLAATREHLRRLVDGGTHHISNLAIACFDCNNSRGNRTWLEWKTIKMGEALE